MTCNEEMYDSIRRYNENRERMNNDPELRRQAAAAEADAQAKLDFFLTLKRLGVYEQFSESAKYAKDEQSQKACRDFWHAYCYVVPLPIAE